MPATSQHRFSPHRVNAAVRGAICLAAALAIAPASHGQSADLSDNRSLPPKTVEKLDKIVAKAILEQNLPSVAVGIWIPGQGNYVVASGDANLLTHTPRTLTQPFRIASVTKTFVGTVVLQLVDEGLIKKTDPIAKWFPGFPHSETITVDDLLRMQSGIPDPLEQLLDVYFTYPLLPIGPDFEIGLARLEGGLFTKAGDETVYSNINFVMLQRIAERVTGKSFAELLRTMINAPLRLTHTTFPSTPAMPGTLHGYAYDAGSKTFVDRTQSNPNYPNGAGGMISTLADLHRYVPVLCGGGLLRPETQADRLRSHLFEGSPNAGYGEAIVTVGKICGHNGTQIGFSTEAWYIKPSRAVVVINVNRLDADDKSQSEKLFMAIVTELFPDAAKP